MLVYLWIWSAISTALLVLLGYGYTAQGRLLRRRQEPPALPAAACEACGGAWTKWSAARLTTRSKDPNYPATTAYTVTAQSRTCQECGLAEERTVP